MVEWIYAQKCQKTHHYKNAFFSVIFIKMFGRKKKDAITNTSEQLFSLNVISFVDVDVFPSFFFTPFILSLNCKHYLSPQDYIYSNKLKTIILFIFWILTLTRGMSSVCLSGIKHWTLVQMEWGFHIDIKKLIVQDEATRQNKFFKLRIMQNILLQIVKHLARPHWYLINLHPLPAESIEMCNNCL